VKKKFNIVFTTFCLISVPSAKRHKDNVAQSGVKDQYNCFCPAKQANLIVDKEVLQGNCFAAKIPHRTKNITVRTMRRTISFRLM